MSWTFQLQKINQAFDHIAAWYQDFMNRTERCFRSMHERILQLEDRQDWQGPSDEQVERVLRKILAERFSDGTMQQVHHNNTMKEADYFVGDLRKQPAPRPIPINVASLLVDPEAVPSKAYADTIQMLEARIKHFPNLDHENLADNGARNVKLNYEMEQINGSGHA